jgi:hypothetical protein
MLSHGKENSGGSSRGVNIGVIVRARPLSDEEKAADTPVVLSCDPKRKEVLVSASVRHKTTRKTYTYDKVYGQFATQEEVYDGAVAGIVDEVLAGFNCTVFAYGQTGTGKSTFFTCIFTQNFLIGSMLFWPYLKYSQFHFLQFSPNSYFQF